MPFCPKCKYEYREGIEVCPDCDLQLKAHLHADKPREEQIDDPVVRLASFSSEAEAQIVKGVLESAGIPVLVEGAGPPLALYTTVITSVLYLSVPESKLEQARKVVQSALATGS